MGQFFKHLFLLKNAEKNFHLKARKELIFLTEFLIMI